MKGGGWVHGSHSRTTSCASPKGSLHWEVKDTGVRAGLEIHTSDNLAVSGARWIFQKKSNS
jgi:hypothetical protein